MMASEGPYSIGSDHWPGLSKVMEEAAELVVVCAKLMATNGDRNYWDGRDLLADLHDEMGDVTAAILFLMDHNALDHGWVKSRAQAKRKLFQQWQEERSG